jgi:hypothetical protein
MRKKKKNTIKVKKKKKKSTFSAYKPFNPKPFLGFHQGKIIGRKIMNRKERKHEKTKKKEKIYPDLEIRDIILHQIQKYADKVKQKRRFVMMSIVKT